MMRRHVWLLALGMLLVSVKLYGAHGAAKGAVIKGTITVKGRPTSDAVVSLEGVPAESIKARRSGFGAKKAVMKQSEMKFVPRVLPVLVGTTVSFPNSDTTWHNIYSKSEAKNFDLGLYPPGQTRSTVFDKAGVVRILCNVHPAMEAFIVVKEHPFFAATDGRGNYRLDGAPLGQYRVQVWHPQYGTTETSVTLVREGEVLDVNFDLKK